ncbi:MAG: formate/nitrite transporter family protein [Eubacterium sp.]|jgi:formate/nitrite transporter FocA (FNT family)|nr:formate/nitrite transporter family protein [Eubacterium sp.]
MNRYLHAFVLAVLAGIAIGIGGTVYLSMDNKTAGALMFTVGLYTICIHGLNLYTGKVGYAPNQPAAYLLDLLVIWAGNLAGTGMAALGVRQTRISGIADKAAALCEVKLQDSMASLFLLAVFCGFLMFIAVDGYKQSGSPVILFLGVGAFILCGFEHCIADMFYFSVAGMWPGRAVAAVLVITLGNSVGGILIPLAKKNAVRIN